MSAVHVKYPGRQSHRREISHETNESFLEEADHSCMTIVKCCFQRCLALLQAMAYPRVRGAIPPWLCFQCPVGRKGTRLWHTHTNQGAWGPILRLALSAIPWKKRRCQCQGWTGVSVRCLFVHAWMPNTKGLCRPAFRELHISGPPLN
jgi:hypothetical protein